MINKLRTLCERKSNKSKKHKSDVLFNSNSEVGSETGKSTILALLTVLSVTLHWCLFK